ncbi:flagellin [Kordiimonas lipolytica]|uniref:Flagellin n=1 Tax=Kordiimonas lipolytica TaxID=1662421 RepID=A0ABV8U8N2_9PROT|nr:flagellin [Kordiimonas lipolytica]
MVFTVDPNAGAFAVLQNKKQTGKSLAEAQAKADQAGKTDERHADSAVTLEGQLEGDASGLEAVKASLGRAASALDVASAAARKVSDLLSQLQEKAERGLDPDLDEGSRAVLNEAFATERDLIGDVIRDASFDGINAIARGGQSIAALTSANGRRAVEVPAQDLALGGPNVTLKPKQGLESVTAAADTLEAVVASRANVDKVQAVFEAGSESIDAQQSFIGKLSATIEAGVGNLVETSLESETANLQALQVKQALGVQPLPIANQRPQAILSLLK